MSEVKVNKISPRTNCGTVTLGDSGDTFTIPAGVSITNSGTASGFGATGAVSWNTTVKTSGFTATAGEGYFVNTTGGAVSVNLPAGTAGAVVGFKDYADTFDTNALTLVQNGSDKIGGSTINATLNTEGTAITLVFIDSTQGWLVTDSGLQSEAPTQAFVTATGGTITTSGDYKLHTFTAPGTFTVTCAGSPSGSSSVSSVIVAGGGGGGADNGAGAGAGGFLGATTIPVLAQAYPITVGGGGAGGTPGGCSGSNGTNSVFSVFTSIGGGGGQQPGPNAPTSIPGGSGGGASRAGGSTGGTGTQADAPGFPSSAFNNNGGTSTANHSGGGGGAGGVGANAPPSGGGLGGNGKDAQASFHPNIPAPSFVNSGVYAGGGGAGSSPGSPAPGGGGIGTTGPSGDGGAGTVNTGGGGGGGAGGTPRCGGNGGSGIVIISYKFQ